MSVILDKSENEADFNEYLSGIQIYWPLQINRSRYDSFVRNIISADTNVRFIVSCLKPLFLRDYNPHRRLHPQPKFLNKSPTQYIRALDLIFLVKITSFSAIIAYLVRNS
ncbi:hypothetical protein ES705_26754 [subsurface metagenome]